MFLFTSRAQLTRTIQTDRHRERKRDRVMLISQLIDSCHSRINCYAVLSSYSEVQNQYTARTGRGHGQLDTGLMDCNTTRNGPLINRKTLTSNRCRVASQPEPGSLPADNVINITHNPANQTFFLEFEKTLYFGLACSYRATYFHISLRSSTMVSDRSITQHGLMIIHISTQCSRIKLFINIPIYFVLFVSSTLPFFCIQYTVQAMRF